MTATAAVPTASLKSVFSLLNDWFPIFGARSDGLLSAKSKGRFRLSDGRLAILVNGRYQSDAGIEGKNEDFHGHRLLQTGTGRTG